jgi:hypothetical protein
VTESIPIVGGVCFWIVLAKFKVNLNLDWRIFKFKQAVELFVASAKSKEYSITDFFISDTV